MTADFSDQTSSQIRGEVRPEYQYGIRWTDGTVTACRDIREAQEIWSGAFDFGIMMVAREVVGDWLDVVDG